MSVPSKIEAMAYLEKGTDATKWSYEPKPMAVNDVDLVVTYNGVCATDLHMADNDWGMSKFPLVPGHEVVGHVLGVGAEVKHLEKGDVVGLGALCQACKKCDWCKQERDNLCPDRRFTYFATTQDETGEHRHYGGFSGFLRTDGRLLFKIPTGYPEEYVGPLMCGGLTVAAPLHEFCGNSWDAKGKKIGVVGIGGLGHMGVMFASKMGAETIAISRNAAKKDFAQQLGAAGYLDTSDEAQMKAAAGTFHYLLICISGGKLDMEQYLPLLRPYGHLHFVGVPEEKLNFNVMPLIFGRLTISGSPIGSSDQMRAMLDFAAEKDIKPIIEVFPHSKANEAVAKVRDGSIRFRAVLKNDLEGNPHQQQ